MLSTPSIVDRDMFMRYRGGGIGHGYMRVIESRFEDMRRQQDSPEEALHVALPPLQDLVPSAGGQPISMPGVTTSAGNTSIADDDSDDWIEEESAEDERPNISCEDDYLAVGEEEDEDDGEEIGQGTYGLGEY
jgi:hypothetical protein